MKTTTLELTQSELQTLVGVLDAGVDVLKLKAVLPLAPVVEKLEQAGKAFAPAGNGVDVMEVEKAKYAETHIDVADVPEMQESDNG